MKQKEEMAGDRHLASPAVERRGGAGRGVSLLANAQEQGERAEKGPPLGRSEPFQFSGNPYLNSHLRNYYLPWWIAKIFHPNFCKHFWTDGFAYMYKRLSEKAMAPHASTLAWKIPWTEESGGLQSMGSLRVEHDWATSLSLFTFMHWRRKWQPTPVFLSGESQGRGSLVGCRLWGRRVGHDRSDLEAVA